MGSFTCSGCILLGPPSKPGTPCGIVHTIGWIFLARAIVNNPQIMLADEPTGNLDSKTSEEVTTLFRELNAAGQTVVMVTHNPENDGYADRTIHLKDGIVVDS
jgi:ABC-type lipoprotein export system ATPase subunit